jgi:hypothetical protein
LVAALTGTRPSDGFVHSLIGLAAGAVAETNRMIRALITAAHVVSCDETPIRVGPRKVKKHLSVACTAIYTCTCSAIAAWTRSRCSSYPI